MRKKLAPFKFALTGLLAGALMLFAPSVTFAQRGGGGHASGGGGHFSGGGGARDSPAAARSISRDQAVGLAPSPVRGPSRVVKASRGAADFLLGTVRSTAGSGFRAMRAALTGTAAAIIAAVDFTAAVTTAASIQVTATASATTAARTAIQMATMTSGATGFPAARLLPYYGGDYYGGY